MTIMCRDSERRQIEQCTDPDHLASLARCLGKCKSTPDLSFTAVSLLTKTLTARATRLETSASKARLAADKEAFRTTTVNKRQRDSGPKNASEFMRQTIRNRHNKFQHKNHKEERFIEAAGRTELPFSGDAVTYPSRAVFQPRRQGPWSSTPSLLPQRGDDRACGIIGSTPQVTVDTVRIQRRARSAGTRRRDATIWPVDACKQERSSPLDRASDLRRYNSWNLEDDADIRVLLDIERPSVANTRTAKSGGSGTNHNSRGSRCSVQTRPVSCGGHDRCLAAPTGAARGTSSSTSSKGYMPTPRTVARRSRSEAETSSTGKGLDRSDKGQQQQRHRGERLGRGGIVDGAEVQKLFEVTAMGRKVHPLGRAAAEKPERWLPAKTLNGLDRLQRSRMLASKRPEVTGSSAWAGQRQGRQEGPARRGHLPYGMCTRWLT